MEKMSVAHTLARRAARTGRKLRPHDLRRTFRTMLARIGVAPHVAELCLGHIEKETMRRSPTGTTTRRSGWPHGTKPAPISTRYWLAVRTE
jgi:integrase